MGSQTFEEKFLYNQRKYILTQEFILQHRLERVLVQRRILREKQKTSFSDFEKTC